MLVLVEHSRKLKITPAHICSRDSPSAPTTSTASTRAGPAAETEERDAAFAPMGGGADEVLC